MTLPVNIQGTTADGEVRQADMHRNNGDTGMVVFTDALYDRKPRFDFAFNPDFGVEMAIDARFTGVAVGLHDGLDSTLWTASSVLGTKFTFNSTDRFKEGAQSVKTDNPAAGDIMQFTHPSSTIDLSNYVALSMFINVDKDWVVGDSIEIYGWDTGGAVEVGNRVKIEDYLNFSQFDQWHGVTISLSDMGLTESTIDAFRIQIITKSGKSPKWYLDVFQVEQAGGNTEFDLHPPHGTEYSISDIRLTMIDAYDATLLNSSMPNLSYDQFLGVSKLNNGINIRVQKDNEIQFAANATCIADFLRAGADLTNMICDGTNTSVTIVEAFTAPLKLDYRKGDKITVTISDDLSGLVSLFFGANGSVRPVS